MFKTELTVGTLKTIAMVAGLAITFWSLGLPYLQLAGAASLMDVSNTLSDSAPGAHSDHTISFKATSGIANGETITIEFPAEFTIGSVDHTDIELVSDAHGVIPAVATCSASEDVGAAFAGSVLTLTLCAGGDVDFVAADEVTVNIGTNTAGGDAQILNPSAAGAYAIALTSGANDSGGAQVAIVDSVTVTATVDTIFTFEVHGTSSATEVNGDETTVGTTATNIPFGTLTAEEAVFAAQNLKVTTNANNGYTVTVQVDGPLLSSTGADIDGFIDGSDTDTPTSWTSPGATIGQPNTYGHWGVTSDDALTHGRNTEFAAGQYIAASTTPRVVMGHNGPSDGVEAGVGMANVGYMVEISAFQEAASDYATTLTYVATPTF